MALACGNTTAVPARDDSPIQTDALVYRLRRIPGGYDATAIASYTNRTGQPVYFARCDPTSTLPIHFVVREPPDETPSVVGAVWACVGGVPTGVIAPDSGVTVEVWLGSLDSPNAQPPIRPEERVGLFRIVFQLHHVPGVDPDAETLLPLEERRSNVFRISF